MSPAIVHPLVLSASRATDIPSSRLDWFLNAVREGGCEWRNPFSGARTWVSFSRARVVVLWSKNFAPLVPHLPMLEARGLAPYFQFTVNDYEAEGYEPGLPPLADRIATFRLLAERYGRDRVVWRFDPLLLSDALSVQTLTRRVAGVGEQLHAWTARLVLSFVDLARYPRAFKRCAGLGAGIRELTGEEMLGFAAGLSPHLARWDVRASTCAEDVDLSEYGIAKAACIDACDFLRLNLLTHREAAEVARKDPGQRPSCRCSVSKDIGAYGTCATGCCYCYARR